MLVLLGYPLGVYMARVYNNDDFAQRGRFRWLGAIERGFFRALRVDGTREQDWKSYAKVTLIFSAIFSVFLYGILRLQGHLFLNPDHLPAVPSHIALNTTASFITNTNWQYYGGEYTMSYLSQMAGLAVQNFVSAAVGMAVLAAVVRGIARRTRNEIGNFWRDLYRSLVYILLPLAVILGVILISQGVVADVPLATRPRPRFRARIRRSRAAPPLRRSRSSSSGRTAAASTTRTPPCRSRTRTGSRTSSSCSRSC